MDEDLGADGCNGVVIEVVGVPVCAMIGGDVGARGVGTHVIKCQLDLGNTGVPLGHREVFVCPTQCGDEVVFGGADCTLCFVGTMCVRGDVLGLN